MASLMRLFRAEPRTARPLYDSVVARARRPDWYVEGAVPDTLEGRFAMLATLLSLVTLRLEGGGDSARRSAVSLTECFIDDMDAEMRQMGVGDPVMAKKVGGLVGALGGRVGAWRRAVDGEESWAAVIARSVYREQPVEPAAADHAERQLRDLWTALQQQSDEALLEGALP